MKWITLKLYLLPVIMQEVDTVTENYISLINEIRRTKDQKTVNEFDRLRYEISERIKELEEFYDRNIHDIRITNFEKVRIRLKKLLTYELESIEKIENTKENSTSNIKESLGYKQSHGSGTSFKLEDARQSFSNLNPNRKSIKSIEKVNLDDKTNRSNKQLPDASNKFNKETRKSSSKVINIEEDKNNKIHHNIKTDNTDDITKWKEIVFKIKLTEAEYKLLLKEKAKNVMNK